MVTIERNGPIVKMIDSAGYHVGKLGCLILLNLDSTVASEEICRAERWRLTQAEQMLECVSGEDTDYAI